jgi:hypothetical protein
MFVAHMYAVKLFEISWKISPVSCKTSIHHVLCGHFFIFSFVQFFNFSSFYFFFQFFIFVTLRPWSQFDVIIHGLVFHESAFAVTVHSHHSQSLAQSAFTCITHKYKWLTAIIYNNHSRTHGDQSQSSFMVIIITHIIHSHSRSSKWNQLPKVLKIWKDL